MVFNSIEFILFALLFFLVWPLVKHKSNWRWGFLTIMSFIFYGWWDWRFLFLIIVSGLIDYLCGWAMRIDPGRKKKFLAFSLIGNLGILSIFKYSVFFASILDDLFSLVNIHLSLKESIPGFALILPVGISFYTFQSLSYTIDIYRGRLAPTNNILHFFSYLSAFPQLVAGPIVRAKDFLGQLNHSKKVSPLQKWNAIKLISFGLFQKVVLADNLSYFIDAAFEGKSAFDGSLFWLFVMVAFSFQIYCDFSGYSLIARGIAKFMGYHFKMNFNHPYLSTSLRSFWSRWHISLSFWFRDYVYIPLGGSRKGLLRGIGFLWITMLLSGLWHGANYTYLIWASIHAFFMSLERLTNWQKAIKWKQAYLFLIPVVFAQVMVAWIYFRANSLVQGNEILMKIISFDKLDFGFFRSNFTSLSFLSLSLLIEIIILIRRKNIGLYRFYKKYHLDFALVALAIMMALLFRGEGKQFIYFQF